MEILSERIETLTRNSKLRQMVQDSEIDGVEAIRHLESENRSISLQLDRTQEELTDQREKLFEKTRENKLLATQCREAEEMLALSETMSKSKDFSTTSRATLEKVQAIWRKLGGPIERPDSIRSEIENCLDNTCSRLLQEATQLEVDTLDEIHSLEVEIRRMRAALGGMDEDNMSADDTLLSQLAALRRVKAVLEPTYKDGASRRESLMQQASDLKKLLGLSDDEIPLALRSLLEEESDRALDLREDFLTACEQQVSQLRVRKSQMLVTNAEVLSEASRLVCDMNLAEEDILPLVLNSVKRRCRDIPEWWDQDTAEAIVRAVSTPGGVVRATHAFREHLLVVHAAIESLSRSRRALSDKLKDLVERAQKILLETVDEEVEAIEAYASFHEALFRLPALSKERMSACTAEIEALIICVDDMTQSEIEALVVVHEALSVTSSERGLFWSEVEAATIAVETDASGPFDEVVHHASADGEDWILQLVKDGTKSYRQLESRLVKLQMIHTEVERLRSRQDTKSKIITLDSEVRTLSARLSEFEDKKCSKQRLLTKKSGSVNLLKEERFRKQMQQKFSSKLEKLAILLQKWRDENEEDFDSNLLSDEVRLLLDNGNMVEWVEKRTEFMHLRTTQSTKKHRLDQREETAVSSKIPSQRPNLPRPSFAADARKKSVAYSQPPERKSAAPGLKPASSSTASRKRKVDENPPLPPKPARLTRSSQSQSTPRVPLSPSQGTQASQLDDTATSKPAAAKKKRLTLPPFGHVLDMVGTPRHATEKENLT